MEKNVEIQNLLESVSFSNISQALDYFSGKCGRLDEKLILFTTRDILILSKLRPENTILYSRIISTIETSMYDPEYIAKKVIIEFIQINSKNDDSLAYAYKLFHECFNCGLFKIEDCTNLLKNAKFSEKNYFLLFSFFAQHIQRYHYMELLYKISKKYQKDRVFSLLESKKFSEVDQFLSYGFPVDSINFTLKYDNFDEFQKLSSQPNFDFNQTLSFSIFECSSFPENSISMINFAAFFGAMNCFKHIFLNNAAANNTKILHDLSIFAILGGNKEIIHFAEQNGCDFNGTLGYAAYERRNDVFDLVLTSVTRSVETASDELFHAVCRACQVNNISAVMRLLTNYEIKSFGINGECPLDFCISNECVECGLLLIDKGMKFDPLCLHHALEKRIDSIVMKILDSDASYPQMRDEKGRTAIDIACESCSFDEALELAKNPNLHQFVTTEVLDKAYKCGNYDFLSAFADLNTYQPSRNMSENRKSNIKCLSIFTFTSIIIVILWLFIFTRI